MGARHALFRPFAAPRAVKIPESPRGWYGADRHGQQGLPRSRRSAVRRLRRSVRASYLLRADRPKSSGFAAAAHSAPAIAAAGAPPAVPATCSADGPSKPARPGSQRWGRRIGCGKDTFPQPRVIRTAMHHDGTARLTNAPAVGLKPAASAAAAATCWSRAPRSDELRAGGLGPRAHRDGRSAAVRANPNEHHDQLLQAPGSSGPALTICRRRWR